MPEPNFEEINAAIRRAGVVWEAGETSRSRFFAEGARGNLFGLSFDPERERQVVTEARQAETSLFRVAAPPPPAIDWRSHQGQNYVTPVRDQGTCGACVSFATCGSLEARALIAARAPGATFDLSEAHLFYCGTTNACDVGWFYTDALDFARRTGVGLEADFPYRPGNQACQPIPPVIKVASYTTASSSIARKRALQNGPVIGGMEVFGDFLTYRGGVYQHVFGNFLGWHAVTIVGYDDRQSCWLAKNSWGPGWGENGFFRIAYGDSGMDSKVLFYAPEITILRSDALQS